MLCNNNLYSVDVLVNGNTCKQYKHDGKLFIEAKHGSEYEIKIGNHTWARILSVTSVDGLNVLNGETACEDDSGYVISGYDSLRIKGFRYSDDKVGAFKFTSKNSSYAANKNEGNNVGVIGVRIFNEHFVSNNSVICIHNSNTFTGKPYYPWTTTTCNSGNTHNINWNMSCNSYNSYGISPVYDTSLSYRSANITKGFDMGTDWGQVKESKVNETVFEKGYMVFNLDIYYASRESLIEMGVSITNKANVSFPNSFPKKYATPPKGWTV